MMAFCSLAWGQNQNTDEQVSDSVKSSTGEVAPSGIRHISTTTTPTVIGDVNGDNEFNASDLVTMQKYLLGAGTLKKPENGDLDSDNTLDVFDLISMRKLILR